MKQTTHKKNISGSEALLLSLINEGVDTLFGYPGGSIMPVYDELLNFPELKHYLTRHEQGAVHAAQGYARVSGRTGTCLVTSGPGATNLLTGIADAMLDSTPLVCISSQVPSTVLGTDFFQEADMVNMTIPITKWNYQVTRHDEIAPTIAKAFYIAASGRPGPVYVEIAKDALVGKGDYTWEKCEVIRSYRPVPEINETEVEAAAALINEAERPLILMGNGVKISSAETELLSLAEKAQIPVAATLLGIGAIPTQHPLYVGMLGMHGNIAPNVMTQKSDLIIAVGMRFSDRVTGNTKTYAPNAKVIHIEIDPVEVNKNILSDVAVVGDARAVLEALVPRVEPRGAREEWFALARQKKEKEWEKVIKKHLFPEREALTMGEAVAAVAEATAGDAVIVTDVGQQQMFASRYSQFNHTRSLVTSGGLGTMGFGLPAAIGAKVALPGRQVVAFLGDGGFQMTMQELGTILHWGIGVKVVVLNNSFLGMVRQWQQLFHEKRYSSTALVNPDFVKIAEAYKIPAVRVARRDDLRPAIDAMLAAEGPYFLEVVINQEDNVFPMIPAGAALEDQLYTE